MSKLKFSSDFIAYSDINQTNDPKDQTKIQQVTEEKDFKSLLRSKIKVLDAVVDQSIAVPEANSEYLLIYTDQEITIKLDGATASRTLKPRAVGVKTLTYMERGSISTILVSNASGLTANLDIISVKL